MSAWDLAPPSSTFPAMTRPLTPCWTHVEAGHLLHRWSGSRPTATWTTWRHTQGRGVGRGARSPPPGSALLPTPWDCNSSRAWPPSLCHWRRRHRTSWWSASRGGPSPSCHVTFTNIKQRARASVKVVPPPNTGPATFCRTINFFLRFLFLKYFFLFSIVIVVVCCCCCCCRRRRCVPQRRQLAAEAKLTPATGEAAATPAEKQPKSTHPPGLSFFYCLNCFCVKSQIFFNLCN